MMNSGIDTSGRASSAEAAPLTSTTHAGQISSLDAGSVCHQCSACSFASEDRKFFSRHLKRDHRVKEDSDSEADRRQSLFPCSQGCAFETDRFDAYRTHYTAHVRFRADPRRPEVMRYFQCVQCPYVSSVMLLADAHMDDAHPDACSSFTVQRVKLLPDVPTLPVSISVPVGKAATSCKVEVDPAHSSAPSNAPSSATSSTTPVVVVPSPPPLIHHGVRPPPPVYAQRHCEQSNMAYRSPLEQMQEMQRYQHHHQQHLAGMHRPLVPQYPQHNGYAPMHVAPHEHSRHRQHMRQLHLSGGVEETHVYPGPPLHREHSHPSEYRDMKAPPSDPNNDRYHPPIPIPQDVYGGHDEEDEDDDEEEDEELQSLGCIEMSPYIKKEPPGDDYSAEDNYTSIEAPLKRLQDLEPLQQHGHRCSAKNSCPVCGDSFSSSGNMKRHMRRRHGNQRNVRYDEPSRSGQTVARYPSTSSQQQRKRTSSLMKCRECPFRCTTHPLLDKHMANHAKMMRIADGYKCAYCTARTRYPVYMRRHLNTYHRDQPAFASQVSENRISSTLRDMSEHGAGQEVDPSATRGQEDNKLDTLVAEFIGFLPVQDIFDEPTKCCNCDFTTTDRSEIIDHITANHMSKVII